MSLLRSDNRRFLWHTALLLNSGMIAGALYMLVHPILGRGMGDIEYAMFFSLLGLLNLLAFPAPTLQVVMARYVAEYEGVDAASLWVTVLKRAFRRLTILGLAGLLLWSVLAQPLKGVLNVSTAWGIVFLGVVALARLYAPIIQGCLQGSEHFAWYAASQIGGAAARVGLAFLAVWWVGTVSSVMIAFAISTVVGLVIGAWPLRRVIRDTPMLKEFDTRPLYRYLWPVLIGQCALFLIMNVDLILYPRLLNREDIAVYAKAAALSRIVLFMSQPIATVMFPRAVRSKSLGILLGPATLTLAVSVAVATVLSLFPDFMLKLMFEIENPDPMYGVQIRLYVWAALPLSLCSMLCQYLWARHQTGPVFLLLPVLALYGVAVFKFGNDPIGMIVALALGSWVSLLVLGWFAFRHREAS